MIVSRKLLVHNLFLQWVHRDQIWHRSNVGIDVKPYAMLLKEDWTANSKYGLHKRYIWQCCRYFGPMPYKVMGNKLLPAYNILARRKMFERLRYPKRIVVDQDYRLILGLSPFREPE